MPDYADPDTGCMDWRPDLEECTGELIDHYSDLGTHMIRCARHLDERDRRLHQIRRDYPDSPMAPSWFDPLNAGERWDDDY